ncbi:hypothetical protein L7F22_055381 [Adiantum nelumboides]|nr:hypothetical protein [Adiantum nelumboides]
MRREQAESGLRFLGLIIFENKIKDGTAPAIATLTNANIICKMATGDNPRTAISVARECGMVGPSAHVFVPTFVSGSQKEPAAVIDWSSVDDERVKLDPYKLKPFNIDPHVFGRRGARLSRLSAGPHRRCLPMDDRLRARRDTEENAHQGHRLRENEPRRKARTRRTASGARIYGWHFVSISLLSTASPPRFQTAKFLYVDLFCVLPVAVTMARTLPYPDINPKRPTANLVSKKVLISMLGQVFVCAIVQAFVFFHVRAQPWYVPPEVDPSELNTSNPENSALFLVSSFQYLIVAAAFSAGPPYRQPMYTNVMLMLSLSSLTLLSVYFLFATSGPIFDMLELVEFPRYFHMNLLAIVIVNAVLCFLFEAYMTRPVTIVIKGIQRFVRRLRRGTSHHDRSKRHDSKMYKAVVAEWQNEGEA